MRLRLHPVTLQSVENIDVMEDKSGSESCAESCALHYRYIADFRNTLKGYSTFLGNRLILQLPQG